MIFSMRYQSTFTCLASIALLAMTSITSSPARAANSENHKTEFVGHRGESHDAPENTLSAIKLAWERKDDGSEFDIHLTKDGKLIVIHDYDTLRVTGGKDGGGTKLVVKDSTVDELRKLDAGSFKDPKFAGEKLPLFTEMLGTVPKEPGHRLFIEIKVGPECVDEFVRDIKAADVPMKQTACISFQLDSCREVKKRLLDMQVYYLADNKVNKTTGKAPTLEELISDAKAANLDGLDLSQKFPIDRVFVEKIHNAGLQLYTWTIDDPEVAKKYVEWSVDGITSNRAAWLREQVMGKPETAQK